MRKHNMASTTDLRHEIISVGLRVVTSNTQQNDETVSDLADNVAFNGYAGTRDALNYRSHLMT